LRKYYLFLFLTVTIFGNAKLFSQNRKVLVGISIIPSLGLSSITKGVISDQTFKVTSTSRKIQPFLGIGYVFYKPIKNNNYIGLDISYLFKGYFTNYTTVQYSGGGGSTLYSSRDIAFLQTIISFGKKTKLQRPNQFFTRSIGVFYGVNSYKVGNQLGNLLFETNTQYEGEFGNDLGIAITGGIQLKRFILNGNFEKGIIKYKNNNDINLTTTILGLKLIYQLSKYKAE
jgi:hypothetical protein